jgi:hypothetical protein
MALLRPEERVAIDLEMRVWGMGADGRAFTQHARARNISAAGALHCRIKGAQTQTQYHLREKWRGFCAMKIVPPCANAGQLRNMFALAKAAFEGGYIYEGIARRLLALRPRNKR